MPQSDVLAFVSQYFWLVLTFFGFVVMLSNVFLPKTMVLLFVRNKLGRFSEVGQLEGTKGLPVVKFSGKSLESLHVSVNKDLNCKSLESLSTVDSNYLNKVSLILLK